MTILKKSVSLNPGETKAVGFQFTPSQAKTYGVFVNGLAGSFVASEAPTFDPWIYDLNGDGYIDDMERLKATQDYFALIITKQQMLQVLNLPSPPAPPPPPECVTHAEKLKAAEDYFAGLITKQEMLHIANLPTCP